MTNQGAKDGVLRGVIGARVVLADMLHQAVQESSKGQEDNVDSTLRCYTQVARNHRNFRCARLQVAILLTSLIFISSRKRLLLCSVALS